MKQLGTVSCPLHDVKLWYSSIRAKPLKPAPLEHNIDLLHKLTGIPAARCRDLLTPKSD